jgi:Ni/Co efflux regulator RcnB
MRLSLLLPVLLIAGFVLASAAPHPALAQDAATVIADAAKDVFTEVERRTIDDYYKKIMSKFPAANATKGSTQTADDDDGGKKGKKKDKGKKGGKEKEGLPPGLAKKDQLPPGLQKHLEKNGALPPGLQKRALPADLEAKLPTARKGQERVIVDNDVVLVETATGKVLDVLRDVIKGRQAPTQ